MKIFLYAATLGGYNALPLEGDELKARVNFDYWARTSKTEHNIDQSNVPVKPITETGANRLRGIRADLLTLLASVPDDKIVATPTQNSDDSGNSQDNYSGDGSGDYLVDDVITTQDLVYNPAGESAYADLTNPSDQLNLAQLVRNGLIDDDSVFVNGQQDDLGEEIIPLGSVSKDQSDSSTNQNQERAFGLFDKVDNDESPSSSADLTADWSANQMPVFEKYQANRNTRLINGQNSNADSSSWLGYSLLGSIGAILVTVSATVCVRRLNSKKAQNSGTPIQKLKRESIGNQSRPNLGLSGSRPFHGSQVNFGQGYNPAMRPQFFNPNQPIGGQGFSSAMSVHSGATSGWGPNQNPVSNHGSAHGHNHSHGPSGLVGHSGPPSLPRTGPVTSKTHSLSSGYGSHMPLHGGSHMPSRGGHMANMPYPNQNRALPPPPYAKIQY